MSFRSRERAEEIEIEAAANWAKAKAGFRVLGFTGKVIALTLALSFAYFGGEKAGIEACNGSQFNG